MYQSTMLLWRALGIWAANGRMMMMGEKGETKGCGEMPKLPNPSLSLKLASKTLRVWRLDSKTLGLATKTPHSASKTASNN